MPSGPAAGFLLTEAVASWLVSAPGRDVLAGVVADLDGGADELAVAARLRRDGVDGDRARGLLDAAQARRRARERYPDADELVLTTSALEQASHPSAAAWRARRYGDAGASGRPVLDLGSGVGGDTLAIAASGPPVTAVDLDPARLVLLRHNAAVRGLDVTTVVADVLDHPVPSEALVHADPGRRRDGRRLRRLGEYLPPVPDLLAHTSGAAGVGVVVSPAVDLGDPGLPDGVELEFVQHDRQLLEASLWRGDLRRDAAVARATLLPAGESRSRTGPPVPLPVAAIGAVLLEPAPAAVRARLHDELGAECAARRIARRRALLTADAVPDGPWFRSWLVEDVLPLRAKAVRQRLRTLEDAPVEIATAGVDADPEEWWRRLGRPPRGPQGRRLHLVRTDDRAVCVVTRPAPERSP